MTFGIAFSFSRIPSGGFGSRKNSRRSSHSSQEAISSARSIRRREAKTLIATGRLEPSTFSKSSAGPAGLDRAVGDLGDLEPRRDALADADEIALRPRARLRNADRLRYAMRLPYRGPAAMRPAAAIGTSASMRPTSRPRALWTDRLGVGGERAADLEGQHAEPLEGRERDGVARPRRAVLDLEGEADRPAAARGGRRPTA